MVFQNGSTKRSWSSCGPNHVSFCPGSWELLLLKLGSFSGHPRNSHHFPSHHKLAHDFSTFFPQKEQLLLADQFDQFLDSDGRHHLPSMRGTLSQVFQAHDASLPEVQRIVHLSFRGTAACFRRAAEGWEDQTCLKMGDEELDVVLLIYIYI